MRSATDFFAIFHIFWGLVPGFVSWVLGIVRWVLGFVSWMLGSVFWVSGFVSWVSGFVFWVSGFVFWVTVRGSFSSHWLRLLRHALDVWIQGTSEMGPAGAQAYILNNFDGSGCQDPSQSLCPVSYTHLTLPTTPYV